MRSSLASKKTKSNLKDLESSRWGKWEELWGGRCDSYLQVRWGYNEATNIDYKITSTAIIRTAKTTVYTLL